MATEMEREMKTRTRVIVARHECHYESFGKGPEDVLTDKAKDRAKRRGAALKEKGIEIDHTASGGKWDHNNTLSATLEGYGKMVPLAIIDSRLGDTSQDPNLGPNFKPTIKAKAKPMMAEGVAKDVAFTRVVLSDSSLHKDVLRRAEECANALCDIARKFIGKTTLVTSSAVVRLEVGLEWLQGKRGDDVLKIEDKLFGYGQMSLLELDVDDETGEVELVSFERLDLIADQPKGDATFVE